MKYNNLEKIVARVSIGLAITHFFVETIWHFKVGQFLPMLIVDYIAVSLLLYAGWQSLKTSQAAGLLCGAWGFTFCLNYRSLFWRVEEFLGGNEEVATEVYFLAFCLCITGSLFLITLYLAKPKKNV